MVKLAKPRSLGMTLTEVIVVMGLMGMVLAMTSLLVNRTFRILEFADNKNNVINASHCLDRIVSEMQESVAAIAPGAAINITKANPVLAPFMGISPTSDPSTWPSDYTGNTIAVRYSVDTLHETLVRRVGGADEVVAHGINNLSVAGGTGRHVVTITVLENGRTVTLTRDAIVWGVPHW